MCNHDYKNFEIHVGHTAYSDKIQCPMCKGTDFEKRELINTAIQNNNPKKDILFICNHCPVMFFEYHTEDNFTVISTLLHYKRLNIKEVLDPYCTLTQEILSYFNKLTRNPRKNEIRKNFNFSDFIMNLMTIQSIKGLVNPDPYIINIIVSELNRAADSQHLFEDQETCSDILQGLNLAIRKFACWTNSEINRLGYEISCPLYNLPKQESSHEVVIGSDYCNFMITVNHDYNPDIDQAYAESVPFNAEFF